MTVLRFGAVLVLLLQALLVEGCSIWLWRSSVAFVVPVAKTVTHTR